MSHSTKQIAAACAAGATGLAALFGACTITLVGVKIGVADPSETQRARTACYDPPETDMPVLEHAAKRAFICTFMPGINVGESLRQSIPPSPVAPQMR